MVVDVDTLIIVAVKEMIVNDSKQSAVLRHELGVLHPQLQPDIRARRVRGPPYRRARAPVALRSLPKSPPLTAAAVGANIPVGRAPRARRPRGHNSSSSSSGGVPVGDQALRDHHSPCPHMPRYFGSFVTQDASGRSCVSIVLEHIPGVDLHRWIEESGSGLGPEHFIPPEQWLACVCRDLVEALRYLHERRRIHRDVKPANVLLAPGGAKLADFGSTIKEDEGAGHRMHGTIRFMSPERLWERQYRPSSDLWATGLTIAATALGENPIPHCSTEFDAVEHAMAAFDMVAAHPRASRLSPELLDFLRVVLVADPDKRPTAEEMLEHPFVRQAIVVSSDGEGDGGGNGGWGGADDLLGFRRNGFGLGMEGRKRRAERVAPNAREHPHTGGCVGGSNGDNVGPCSCGRSRGSSEGRVRGGKVEWRDAVQQQLQHLRRKYVPPVDASDVARRVLAARRSRWGHAQGSGVGLKNLDFSPLATELAMGSAELRSLFGSVAANMDGGDNTGSWSSPAPSTGSSELTSTSSTRETEVERERPQLRPTLLPSPTLSPPRSRQLRSPLPRRRPPPLIVSPARPRIEANLIPLSAPASPIIAKRAASPIRGRSAVWIRALPARNRKHAVPETLREAVFPEAEYGAKGVVEEEVDIRRSRSVAFLEFARSGIAWGKGNHEGGGEGRGEGRGGWWKRRGFRLRRLFKSDKSTVAFVVEPGTTELPSPRPDETPGAFGTPYIPTGTEDHDGEGGGARRGVGDEAEAVSTGERCGPAVHHVLGRVAGQRSVEKALLESRVGVCDGQAPAWEGLCR